MKSLHSTVVAICLPFVLSGCAGSSQPAASEPVGQSSAGSSTANSSNTASTTTTTITDSNPNPQPSMSDAGVASASATDAGAATPAAAEAPMPPMPTGLHGPSTPWDQMNSQAKGRYMHDSVLPAMTSLFQAYDASGFSTVNCATCHGPNARATHFHMPNPTLPPLPAFGSEASTHMMSQHARMFQFMGQRVVPVMAALIGEAPYNPQTHQGFGCFECHTHAAN